MGVVYEILAGAVAVLYEMEEERHDPRFFLLIAAIERAMEMVDSAAE